MSGYSLGEMLRDLKREAGLGLGGRLPEKAPAGAANTFHDDDIGF